MKAFKHYLFIVATMAGLMSTAGCSDDEEIVHHLVGAYGKVWEGDLGATDDYGYPLVSDLVFRENGLGREELYYMDNGEFYDEFPFRWELDWDNTIFIYYKNGDRAYITDYIIGINTFQGYWRFNGDREIPFTLRAR